MYDTFDTTDVVVSSRFHEVNLGELLSTLFPRKSPSIKPRADSPKFDGGRRVSLKSFKMCAAL